MNSSEAVEILKTGLEVSDENVNVVVFLLKDLHNQKNVEDFFAIWSAATKNFRNLSRIHFRLGDQAIVEMCNHAKA